jgi:hypothetical protein
MLLPLIGKHKDYFWGRGRFSGGAAYMGGSFHGRVFMEKINFP